MRYPHRLIIVVPAARQAGANTLAKQVDAAGGERTFTVALARPAAPTVPVAYWCSWALTPGEHTAIRARIDTDALRTAGVRVYDADNWSPEAVLVDLGLVRLEEAKP